MVGFGLNLTFGILLPFSEVVLELEFPSLNQRLREEEIPKPIQRVSRYLDTYVLYVLLLLFVVVGPYIILLFTVNSRYTSTYIDRRLNNVAVALEENVRK